MKFIVFGILSAFILSSCVQITTETDVATNDNPVASSPPAHTRSPSRVDSYVRDFELESLVVSFGTVFTWTNQDEVAHTITSGTPQSPTGLWDSGNLSQGETFLFNFIEQGSFDYFCKIHPDQMQGNILVLPATNNYEENLIHG